MDTDQQSEGLLNRTPKPKSTDSKKLMRDAADTSQANISIFAYSKKVTWDNSVPLVVMTEKVKRDGLEKIHFAAYAVGHFNNDLCNTLCLTFLLYYVKDVVKLPDYISGLVMLSGQLADGISTPIIGLLSDKTCKRFGKRTPWYLFGTILVIPTFLGIFIYPDFSQYGRTVAWYITLPALFNIGNFILSF